MAGSTVSPKGYIATSAFRSARSNSSIPCATPLSNEERKRSRQELKVEKMKGEKVKMVRREKVKKVSAFTILLLFHFFTFSLFNVNGQLSRKPSAMNEPAGAMDRKPDSKKNSLVKIATRE